jgi:hypothetical protein
MDPAHSRWVMHTEAKRNKAVRSVYAAMSLAD